MKIVPFLKRPQDRPVLTLRFHEALASGLVGPIATALENARCAGHDDLSSSTLLKAIKSEASIVARHILPYT